MRVAHGDIMRVVRNCCYQTISLKAPSRGRSRIIESYASETESNAHSSLNHSSVLIDPGAVS